MLLTKHFWFLLTSIVVFVHTMEVNGNQNGLGYQHFGVGYPFNKKIYMHLCIYLNILEHEIHHTVLIAM